MTTQASTKSKKDQGQQGTSPDDGGKGKKSECPVTLDEFGNDAKPLTITVDGATMTLEPRQFKTGSFGWHGNEKITVKVGDKAVRVQANIGLTVIGSKPEKS